MSDRRTPQVVAGAALVLAAAAAGFTTFGADRAAELADAREAAVAEAETRVPELLSYENATLNDDLTEALEQTTGGFTDDYRTVLDDLVRPEATERQISTRATVVSAGLVSGDRDSAVVLLFLNQQTTSGTGGSSVTGSRVEVSMSLDGDEWKIAGLKPV